MENQRIQEYPSERKKVNGESRMVKGKKKGKRGQVHTWTDVACDFVNPRRDNVMLDGPNEKPRETGDRATGPIMLDGRGEQPAARVYPALPVSIGSISLSSCQLFLCARQIVAAGTEAAQRRIRRSRNVEWGWVGLN